MNAILLSGICAVFALTASGAPTYPDGEQRYVRQQELEDYLRERRTPYGPQYVSPCAASSVPIPAFTAPSYQAYTAPQYGYAVPHYRSVDEQVQPELLGFSDMDHVPMARLGGYGAAPVAVGSAVSSVGGRVLTQATSGTALGVFPNANVGGCSVPLLVSCSPSIVSGHIVESSGHYAPAAASVADSYRLVDESVHHDLGSEHEELLTPKHLNTNAHETSPATHQ